MTIKSDLDTQRAAELATLNAAITAFLEGSALNGVAEFLSDKVSEGLNVGIVHMESSINPWYLDTGYTTLSGELARTNAEAPQGLTVKNGTAHIHLSAPQLTISGFQSHVNDFITLLTNEGLTVSSNLGAVMADLIITWP